MNAEKDDKMRLAALEDKFDQCCRQYTATNTGFLDLRQKALAEKRCKELCGSFGDVAFRFFGGYEEAERTVAIFLPDYARLEDSHPLAVIRAEAPLGGKTPTHRDYLGSLTGLGVRREMIGDILTCDKGADILVLEEIKDFLLLNYDKAGRIPLRLASVPLEDLRVPKIRTAERRGTVASLRLDNVISSAFSISRAKAAETIRTGLIFLNGMQAEKPDIQVKEGDKLVLRGKGKAILKEVGGRTRKDRVVIVIRRFL